MFLIVLFLMVYGVMEYWIEKISTGVRHIISYIINLPLNLFRNKASEFEKRIITSLTQAGFNLSSIEYFTKNEYVYPGARVIINFNRNNQGYTYCMCPRKDDQHWFNNTTNRDFLKSESFTAEEKKVLFSLTYKELSKTRKKYFRGNVYAQKVIVN